MHVIEHVGDFGEDFCAHLFGGERIPRDDEGGELMDVYVRRPRLAVQVKMCNRRHASRPTIEQIKRLAAEVGTVGFVYPIKQGVYAFVFYRGYKESRNRCRSKLLSRRLSVFGKRTIIAHELQYVYVVDVRLVQHFVTSPAFESLRRGGVIKVWAKRKLGANIDRDRILYLNRTFLKGFFLYQETPGKEDLGFRRPGMNGSLHVACTHATLGTMRTRSLSHSVYQHQ
ncbi:MAG: hypothetical protein KGI79_03290, partial [Patescibacteria group bacterium]|nr:hypothetical protein [Patescibacteria group bacterium]